MSKQYDDENILLLINDCVMESAYCSMMMSIALEIKQYYLQPKKRTLINDDLLTSKLAIGKYESEHLIDALLQSPQEGSHHHHLPQH